MGNGLVSTSNKIIFYQNDQLSAQIEVKVQDETVWLNRKQLAELFDRDIKTIGKHIHNVLNEELKGISVVANFATTGSDGKTYQVEYYNLDMIISLGFRVKSQRGIHFRIWANSVLKDHMHQRYSINKRILKITDRIDDIENDIHEIKLQLNDHTAIPTQGIFFDGQVFNAHVFASEFHIFKRSHDRFMILDNKEVYHIGASLKDLGKKWFAFTKLYLDSKMILDRI